jgi:hypothetical protein
MDADCKECKDLMIHYKNCKIKCWYECDICTSFCPKEHCIWCSKVLRHRRKCNCHLWCSTKCQRCIPSMPCHICRSDLLEKTYPNCKNGIIQLEFQISKLNNLSASFA